MGDGTGVGFEVVYSLARWIPKPSSIYGQKSTLCFVSGAKRIAAYSQRTWRRSRLVSERKPPRRCDSGCCGSADGHRPHEGHDVLKIRRRRGEKDNKLGNKTGHLMKRQALLENC